MNQPSVVGAASLRKAAGVIVVSSVMFTFISYWRTAAVVLCDMSSTVYYDGAIVESAIGRAAPWFILAVLFLTGGAPGDSVANHPDDPLPLLLEKSRAN
jgi:hypothetical protein